MPPTKPAVAAALQAALAEELAAVTRVAEMARDEIVSDETRAEGKYDTRATEASYLARGQAARIAELRRLLAWFDRFDPTEPRETAEVGALVELGGDVRELVFLVPVGGAKVRVEGRTVRAISPRAPLGQAMAELEAGDAFEVDTPRGVKQVEVLSVG